MQGAVKKWGNSAAIRIPTAVLDAASVRIDQLVDIRAEDGRIVIEKAAPKQRYALDDLLAGITDENRHEPVDPGPPVGREML